MADTRKIVRVFLASPGDLIEERVAVAGVASEINENWADFLGYQIELMGWEDTVSQHGRPQETINQELDRCELFLGMMWMKWGTPPDNEGDYTSGFHEEYDRAVTRRGESGAPEISMFFKNIPDQFLEDKGPDLIKVLDFRQLMIDEKTQLFQQFEDTADLTSIVRKCLTNYLVGLKEQDRIEKEANETEKPVKDMPREESAGRTSEVSSPFSPKGFHFLENFLGKIQHEESTSELNASEIARFRLLSNSISKSGNDNSHIGVHDLNLLFANKNNMDLGPVELSSLARAGFQNFSNENAPLWHWYSKIDGETHALWYSAFGATETEKEGAILVLNRLGALFSDDGNIDKQKIVPKWFSDDSSNSVKIAGIEYLSNYGDVTDMVYISDEFDRNDNNTSRKALEGMIKLSSRVIGDESTALLAISKQFDSIDESILDAALSKFSELETSDLKTALNHRNSKVRLQAFEELAERDELAEDERIGLLEDASAEIRFRALVYSVERGEQISDENAKKILVRPVKSPGFGLLSRVSQSDNEGEEYFENFALSRLREMGQKSLSKMADSAIIYDDRAYFALTEKYFTNWGDDLRANVDDQFVEYFDERVKRYQNLDPKGEHGKTVEIMRSTGQNVRKALMRSALDVICRKAQRADIERVRRNLESDFVGGSVADLNYMGKFGGWEDIETLAGLDPDMKVGGALSIFGDPEFYAAKSRALYKLGRTDINRLMGMDIPGHMKSDVLSLCSEAVYSDLEDATLLELLNVDSTQLRKTAALMAVRVFPVRRLKYLLETYVSTAEYRYYNVIHWLDLGVSLPRSTSKIVAIASVA